MGSGLCHVRQWFVSDSGLQLQGIGLQLVLCDLEE